MPAMNQILGVIMGGGRGSRIYPLTRDRSKPAVPIAGKYRLIDIPISNCVNSGINRIAILTQFNSVSLHRHISRTYSFDPFHRGWVQIWAAEQTPVSDAWYQGTADAVRKQIMEIQSTRAPWVLILAGDHLYRMDYGSLARAHWESDAEVTVAVQPVHRDEAHRFGILKSDSEARIVDFVEKPKTPEAQAGLVSRDDPERPYLGSMGIYMFNTEVLVDALLSTEDEDFGGHVIPRAIRDRRVHSFEFQGYWEDIGTIRSFYEVSLSLTRPNPPFNLCHPGRPIFSRSRYLPGATVHDADLRNALLSDGCRISNATIDTCIVGVRSQIREGAVVRNTILMGSDYYDLPGQVPGGVPLGIGEGCHIEGAIIDKNARVGAGSRILPFPPGTELDSQDWVVRDGIVVIPKNTVLQPGTVIGPG
jgi:glucose-1-phosphate adenylyltransferase